MIIFFLLFYFQTFSQHSSNSNIDWWKKTTVYQIYPRSWYDTNSDGIGDIQGIIEKLDYIKDLGYETIWISPFLQSPQRDFGYDISDYRSISPQYGTMELFETLVQEVHKRNMKLLFDLVMNHTSEDHPWFIESSGSRNNPKADWYIWRNGRGKDGAKRPNNWRSMTGKRAWNYNSVRKQFYYSAFLPFQPDLNYYNPEVKQEMFDIARFWLNKGVDGFRLDIISAIYEDSLMRNNPHGFRIIPSDNSLTIFFQRLENNFLNENSFEFSTELRNIADKSGNSDVFLAGESHGDENVINKFCNYHGKNGLNVVFLFKAVSTPFKAVKYRKMVECFEKAFPEPLMPTIVFGNHDRTRIISRLERSIEKAKLLALFQFTVRGIPFTYYGEEIGIANSNIPIKVGKDAMAVQRKGIPQFIADLSSEIINRDECRTPMLWTGEKNAGFCTDSIKPWLPVASNFADINVEQQNSNPFSLLNFYKKIIHLRNETRALNEGSLEIANGLCTKKIFAYYRIDDANKFLVLLNMSASRVKNPVSNDKILISTYPVIEQKILKPFEGRVLDVS